MKHFLSFLLASILTLPLAVQAQSEDVLDLSLSENIIVPEVNKRAKPYIDAAMDQIRRHFVKAGLKTTTLRDGEVVCVTIPCSTLFGPGSVELKNSSAEILRQFSVTLREPGKYKLLVAVHTDDTGDEMYSDSISAARANAIDDFMWEIAGQTDTNVIPYGIGKDDPVQPNSSRSGREANRRVEFYIVPDRVLLQMAGMKK